MGCCGADLTINWLLTGFSGNNSNTDSDRILPVFILVSDFAQSSSDWLPSWTLN